MKQSTSISFLAFYFVNWQTPIPFKLLEIIYLIRIQKFVKKYHFLPPDTHSCIGTKLIMHYRVHIWLSRQWSVLGLFQDSLKLLSGKEIQDNSNKDFFKKSLWSLFMDIGAVVWRCSMRPAALFKRDPNTFFFPVNFEKCLISE